MNTIFLTRDERTLLNYCLKKRNDSVSLISLSNAMKETGLSQFQMSSSLGKLKSRNLVRAYFMSDEADSLSVTFQFDGYHYHELVRLFTLETILKSVLIPLLVSLLAGVLLH